MQAASRPASAPDATVAAAPGDRGDGLPRRMQCARTRDPLRIAIIYSRLPFPMMRGDQLTVAHLISFLAARGHRVDLFTLDMQGALDPVQADWLKAHCAHVRIFSHGWLDRLGGLIAGLARGLPVQVALFGNRRLSRELRRAATSAPYDILYCYYIRSAPAIPRLRDPAPERKRGVGRRTATFLAMQLSQSLNSRRIHENEKGLLKKLFYRIETRLCENYEARVWRRFDRSVLIGPADVEAVKATCRERGQPLIDNWIYGAHGTDIDLYAPARAEEIVPCRVVFSGSMQYQPNVQAALWFVEQCWPAIRRRFPDAQFVIQGRDPVPAIRALDGVDGIEVTGTVPDVGVLIRSAAVCVNPMLAAGGMQNKLIEYMASGKAVVATSIANEGVRAPSDTLFVADGAEAFAGAVIALLEQPGRALELGRNARAHVVEHWTWEAHFLKLEAEFRMAAGRPAELSLAGA